MVLQNTTMHTTSGMVMGKFYPPHKGHSYILSLAQSQVDKLHIVICSTQSQTIPSEIREKWLHELFPKAKIYILPTDTLAANDEAAWTAATLNLLGSQPDYMFSSEAYGDHYATLLGAKHWEVDRNRLAVPCSATKIRADPLAFLEYLEPCVQDYYKTMLSSDES